jgi:pyruvate,water dikinase
LEQGLEIIFSLHSPELRLVTTNSDGHQELIGRMDLLESSPGLGTRAVDRVSDDYPVLIAPGQPNLRVNVTYEESVRYSPKKIDLINLKTNQFQTIEIDHLIKEVGIDYPQINNIVSVVSNGMLRPPNPLQVDYQDDEFVVTF